MRHRLLCVCVAPAESQTALDPLDGVLLAVVLVCGSHWPCSHHIWWQSTGKSTASTGTAVVEVAHCTVPSHSHPHHRTVPDVYVTSVVVQARSCSLKRERLPLHRCTDTLKTVYLTARNDSHCCTKGLTGPHLLIQTPVVIDDRAHCGTHRLVLCMETLELVPYIGTLL